MRQHNLLKHGLLTMALVPILGFAPPVTAGWIVVSGWDTTPDSGGCGYYRNPCNTVQTGVDNANPGDYVFINVGTYYESVLIRTPALTLTGACTEDTVIDPEPVPQCVDPTRTIFAGGPYSQACRQFQNDQASCEAAWALSFDGPASCWYDTSDGECRGCGPGASSADCLNTCGDDTGITVNAPWVRIKNLTVRNGTEDGIRILRQATGARIENVRITGPDSDCIHIDADDTRVSDSTITGCGSEAIDAGYYDDDLGEEVLDGLTIVRNKITQCDSGCVDVEGDNVLISHNYIRVSEDGDCIELDGDNATIRYNDAAVCDGSSVDLYGNNFTVAHNKTHSLDDDGFVLDCSDCTSGWVFGNLARDITDDDAGFDIYADDPGLVVENNKAIRINDEGFDISGTGIVLRDNETSEGGGDRGEEGFYISGDDHVLEYNRAFNIHGDGFRIHGSGHRLVGNEASRNIEDGFDVESEASDVTLLNNRAFGNNGVGFEVSSSATDTVVDNNTASGNRVDFCDQGTDTVSSGNNFGTTGVCVID